MVDLSGTAFGRYEILEPLGQGGMAIVYKASDKQLDRLVAIKIIRKEAFSADAFEHIRQRFERETRTLARLTHPNIVHIYDNGVHDGSPYLVMEYVPGGTLKQFLGQPMDYRQAARLLAPVTRALAYAHQQGIIHRDVKPANILLTDAGEPMLSDFGIAKIFSGEGEKHETLTGTGMGVGTPEYMAPEQGLGKTVDHRADIYSLGVVFYELVTGRKPFTADTPMEIVVKQMSEPVPPPRQYMPNLPREVEQVLLKALARKPEDRYQEMSNLIDALGKLSQKAPSASKIINNWNIKKEDSSLNPQAGLVTQDAIEKNNISSLNPEKFSSAKTQSGAVRQRLPIWGWIGIGVGIILIIVISASLAAQKSNRTIQLDASVLPMTQTVAISLNTNALSTITTMPVLIQSITLPPTIAQTTTSFPTVTPSYTPAPTVTPACGNVEGAWKGTFTDYSSQRYYWNGEPETPDWQNWTYSYDVIMEVNQIDCRFSGFITRYFQGNLVKQDTISGSIEGNAIFITTGKYNQVIFYISPSGLSADKSFTVTTNSGYSQHVDKNRYVFDLEKKDETQLTPAATSASNLPETPGGLYGNNTYAWNEKEGWHNFIRITWNPTRTHVEGYRLTVFDPVLNLTVIEFTTDTQFDVKNTEMKYGHKIKITLESFIKSSDGAKIYSYPAECIVP